MPDVLLQLSPFEWLQIALGVVLLVVGRRFFWLALAGLGFAAGLYLADQLVSASNPETRLIVALVAGLVGGFVALAAQKLAVGAAGFILGAWGTAEVLGRFGTQSFREAGLSDLGFWIIPLAFVGGLIGLLVAGKLFSAVLVLASSWAGASLVVGPLELATSWRTWTWIGLVVAGIVIQTGLGSGRRPRRARLDS